LFLCIGLSPCLGHNECESCPAMGPVQTRGHGAWQPFRGSPTSSSQRPSAFPKALLRKRQHGLTCRRAAQVAALAGIPFPALKRVSLEGAMAADVIALAGLQVGADRRGGTAASGSRGRCVCVCVGGGGWRGGGIHIYGALEALVVGNCPSPPPTTHHAPALQAKLEEIQITFSGSMETGHGGHPDEGGMEGAGYEDEVDHALMRDAMLAAAMACAVGRPRPVDGDGRPRRLIINMDHCGMGPSLGALKSAVQAVGRAGWVEVHAKG
jgi:hypothetical protein